MREQLEKITFVNDETYAFVEFVNGMAGIKAMLIDPDVDPDDPVRAYEALQSHYRHELRGWVSDINSLIAAMRRENMTVPAIELPDIKTVEYVPYHSYCEMTELFSE